MEKLIRDALMKHMNDCGYSSDTQHGFIMGRSCTTQLLEVVDKLLEMLDYGGSIDMVYLDFSKASDTVPHYRLYSNTINYSPNSLIIQLSLIRLTAEFGTCKRVVKHHLCWIFVIVWQILVSIARLTFGII